MPSSPRRIGPAALTFMLMGAVYAALLCPSLYWLDSGELAAASFELGLLHAPGHPLSLLVGKLFTFVPIGDIALRVGLGQVFCGAGAAAVVAHLAANLARRLLDDDRATDLLGIAAGVTYGASYAAAFQAIRPEVYALSSLLTLGAFACCVRYAENPQPSYLGSAGLLFGLGLANHHYLMLVGAVPPALALLWPQRDSRWLRSLLVGAAGTALTLLVYLYLPLRSAHDPIVRWGHPLDWPSFYWVVSAQSFQKSVGMARGEDVPFLLGALLDQLGPLVTLLGVGGLYVALRHMPRLGIALALAVVVPVAARLFLAFDSGNPDAFAYLGTAVAMLALWAVPLLTSVIAALPIRVRVPAASLVLLLALTHAGAGVSTLSLAGFDDTHATFAPLLESVPSDALVVPSYFQTKFSIDYLRVVEGARPDLHYLPRHVLDHPGERAALAREDAVLAPLLVLPDLGLRTPERPLWLEYDLDLDPSLLSRATEIDRPSAKSDELQSRRFFTWQAVLRLHRLCRLGATEAELEMARSELLHRAGDGEPSPFVRDLEARCPSLRAH